MDKRTSTNLLTVKDPRLTALQIDLHEAERRSRDLSNRLETAHERCHLSLQVPGILAGFEELTELLVDVQARLAECGNRAADTDKLRRIVLNSLRAQS